MCVALWEGLYGTRPFPGISTALWGNQRPATSRDADVPGWLRRACRRGMANQRASRWPSAHALVAALEGGHQRSTRLRVLAGVLGLGLGLGGVWWYFGG